jgi:hypothetical protein
MAILEEWNVPIHSNVKTMQFQRTKTVKRTGRIHMELQSYDALI